MKGRPRADLLRRWSKVCVPRWWTEDHTQGFLCSWKIRVGVGERGLGLRALGASGPT